MSFQALLRELDSDFHVFADPRNGLSPAAITALERALDATFEPSYRGFLAELGCAAALATEAAWPRPRPGEKRHGAGGGWGFEVFGGRATGELPAPLDVRVRHAEANRRARPGVPLLGMLGAHEQLVTLGDTLAWVGVKGGCGGRAECGFPEPITTTFEETLYEVVTRLQADKDAQHQAPPRDGHPSAPLADGS